MLNHHVAVMCFSVGPQPVQQRQQQQMQMQDQQRGPAESAVTSPPMAHHGVGALPPTAAAAPHAGGNNAPEQQPQQQREQPQRQPRQSDCHQQQGSYSPADSATVGAAAGTQLGVSSKVYGSVSNGFSHGSKADGGHGLGGVEGNSTFAASGMNGYMHAASGSEHNRLALDAQFAEGEGSHGSHDDAARAGRKRRRTSGDAASVQQPPQQPPATRMRRTAAIASSTP
jgi:hypothetical protein